ncbi:prominin-1-A-like [Glandiceps talaboti]
MVSSMSISAKVMLVLVVATLLCGDVIEAASQNSVDANGTITWKDLPSGVSYDSPSSYDEGESPLPSMWSMIDGWINTIAPGEIPYNIIVDALAGNFAIGDLTGNITNYADVLFGFAICIVLGFLFLLVFPIVCICFCACRLCGKCGGKMYQKQTDNMGCKKWTFVLILALVTGILSGGCACTYFVDARQYTEFPNVGNNLAYSFNDVTTYVNNTAEEILFVAVNQTNWLFDLIEYEIDNVGNTVGVPVRETLRPYIDPALDSIINMADIITDTRDGLQTLNTQVTYLDSNYTDFVSLVDDLKQEIEDLYSDCATAGGCSTAGSDPQSMANTSQLVGSRDFSDYPVNLVGPGYYPRSIVNVKITGLTSVINNDLTSEAQKGRNEFEDIPELVQNETDAAAGDLTSSFGDFNDEIESGLDPMINNLNTLSSQTTSFQDTLLDYTKYLDDYDTYRGYFMLGLACIALVVVILNTLGIAFGLISCDGDKHPTKRGALSNCSGLLLMASAGISCIFACLFMLLTTFTFTLGGPLDKFVCDPILTREVFANTIDQPDIISGTDGYFLGDKLYQNGNISLTMTGILTDCENNLAAYTAFKLENMVNITEMLNIDSYISQDQFDGMKVNISDQIEIMSTETEDNLADARDVNTASIPFTEFENELNSVLIDFGEDLDNFADNLQSFINTYTGNSTIFPSSFESNFTDMVATIRNFQTSSVDPMVTLRNTVSTALTTVQNDSNTIDTAVNTTISAGNTADDYINNNLDAVVASEVDDFQDKVFGYTDQFVAYVNNMIEAEIGKCLPFYNLLDNLFNTICRSVLDAFNGMWLCCGWCVFFMVFSIIFGIKLAKYFRRMKEGDQYDDGVEMENRSGKTKKRPPYSGNNKIANMDI